MMYRGLALGALIAPLALSAPLEKKQDIDVTVLQFALTLEHLENVFYKGALQKFTAGDFAAAGYGANYYNSLRYISSDEESHTKFLTSALTAAGQKPVAACTYNFPYTDVKSFITLSTVLEGVGTSAYLGGAPLISSKAYLTAAGAILVSEALHTSLQRSAINAVPNANPYGTPLEPNSVYTLAAAFIKSCPSSNAALPFKPYPGLTYDGTPAFCEQPNCGATFAKREAEPEPEPEADANKEPCPESSSKYGYGSYPTTTQKSSPTYGSNPTYYPHPTTTTTKATQPTYNPSSVQSYTTKSSTKTSSYPTFTPAPAPSAPLAGTPVTFTGASNIPAGSFLTFVSGLSVTSVAGQISGQKITAAIPAGTSGQTYVFVTSAAASGNTLTTSQILFGPSILEVKPAPPSIDFNYQK